ncbi:MAG: hypothetical protein Q9209_001443 [Squamulea sp. 1 TL-2023]
MSSKNISSLRRRLVETARANGYPNAYWNGKRVVHNARNTQASQLEVARTTAALARQRALESTRTLVDETKVRASRPLQSLSQATPVLGSRKHERDEDEGTNEDGPNKRLKSETSSKGPSAQPKGPIDRPQAQLSPAAFNIRKRIRDQADEPKQDGPNKRKTLENKDQVPRDPKCSPSQSKEYLTVSSAKPLQKGSFWTSIQKRGAKPLPTDASKARKETAGLRKPAAFQKPGTPNTGPGATNADKNLPKIDGEPDSTKAKDVSSTASFLNAATAAKPTAAEHTENVMRKAMSSKKAEFEDDSLSNKQKLDEMATPPTTAPSLTPTLTTAEPAKPAVIAGDASTKSSLKRKAGEEIGSPIKKSKVEQPAEGPICDEAPAVTEEDMAGKARKLGGGGRSARQSAAGNGKAGRIPSEEKTAKPDTIKTAEMKQNEPGVVEKDGSQETEKQVDPDTGKRPARMINDTENGSLICFANSVIQAIDSIPELRNRLMAKAIINDDAAFPAFPTENGSDKTYREAKRRWHEKVNQMLKEQDRTSVKRGYTFPLDKMDANRYSFGQCLGQTLRHMRAAAQKGRTVCIRGLMKMFSARHPGYDGVSSQQEAFDFLDKVVELLEAEDDASDDSSKQGIALVKDLFGGQKFTQLECTCGHKRDTALICAYSLQLDIPDKCRATTIPSCLNRAFATEKIEGFKCDSCNETVTVCKKDYIKSWGKYLVLQLNRAKPEVLQPSQAVPESKRQTQPKSKKQVRPRRPEMITTTIAMPPQLNLNEFVLDSQLPASKAENFDADSPSTINYEPVAYMERSGAQTKLYCVSIKRASPSNEFQLLIWRAPIINPQSPFIILSSPAVEQISKFCSGGHQRMAFSLPLPLSEPSGLDLAGTLHPEILSSSIFSMSYWSVIEHILDIVLTSISI